MLLPIKYKTTILALGSEFDTRLAFYRNGEIIFSENTDNLAENFEKMEKFILDFVKTHCNASLRRRPDVIITDSHFLFNSRKIGARLAKKWDISHIEVQHHIAHVFSAVADLKILNTEYKIQNIFYGIACDGTGYGLDGNIWGGEVFRIKCIGKDFARPCPKSPRNINIKRIGHLEGQYLIGGDLAAEEPARMIISILSKFLPKNDVFKYVKKYYSAREFNLLWSQLEQKFNCPVSSGTGRVLDAVSIFLGLCENKRRYKHYPVKMLENAAVSRGKSRVKPKITEDKDGEYILDTTYLFEYLIKNINLDKKELGYAVQEYIIEGLYEIVRMDYKIFHDRRDAINRVSTTANKVFFSGGLAENKVMKKFAVNNNIYVAKKIPSGDGGIALGQVVYYLLGGGANG